MHLGLEQNLKKGTDTYIVILSMYSSYGFIGQITRIDISATQKNFEGKIIDSLFLSRFLLLQHFCYNNNPHKRTCSIFCHRMIWLTIQGSWVRFRHWSHLRKLSLSKVITQIVPLSTQEYKWRTSVVMSAVCGCTVPPGCILLYEAKHSGQG